ncbi:hypothetical protein A1O1_00517, partial [Capronia coronata CBS 617.96]
LPMSSSSAPPSYKSPEMPTETSRPLQPMYIIDPETNTTALPYRPGHSSSLEKLYRRACCGSPAGLLLWILGLLVAIVVPIAVLYARGRLSHDPKPMAAELESSASPISLVSVTLPEPSTTISISTSITTTTISSISTETVLSTATLMTTVTSVSVSTVTYSPPSTVLVTTSVVTTATPTAAPTPATPKIIVSLATELVKSTVAGASTVTVEGPSTVTVATTTVHPSLTTRFVTPVTGPLRRPTESDSAVSKGPNASCPGSRTDEDCQKICKNAQRCGDNSVGAFAGLQECCVYCDC